MGNFIVKGYVTPVTNLCNDDDRLRANIRGNSTPGRFGDRSAQASRVAARPAMAGRDGAVAAASMPPHGSGWVVNDDRR
jgi:hypothetical protein